MLKDALGAPLALPDAGDANHPGAGDVWVVSSDGADRGVVLVAAVRETHVLAWPMTRPAPEDSAPAFPVDVPHMGMMTGWPDAEFGLSMAALDRRLGRVLDDKVLRAIRWSLSEAESDPATPSCPLVESPAATEAFGFVCAQAWALGDWAWPDASVGNAAFNREALDRAGIEPRSLAKALGVAPARASALARGAVVPTPQEVATITALFPEGTDPTDILEPVDGDEATVLSFPRSKARLIEVARQRSISERRARSLVWETASSRAARQSLHGDPLDAAQARVDYAFDELLGAAE